MSAEMLATAYERLCRWRDVGDVGITYCAGDAEFGNDVKTLLALFAALSPEPTEGQVERVARAIYHTSCAEADDGERPIPAFDQSHSRLVYLDMARAALAAMPLQQRVSAEAMDWATQEIASGVTDSPLSVNEDGSPKTLRQLLTEAKHEPLQDGSKK